MFEGTLRLRASTLAITAALGLAAPAFAQEAPSAAAQPAAEADPTEIVVTAQKRAESAQAVPISIAAFNNASLTKANVVTVLDLGRVATNFPTSATDPNAPKRTTNVWHNPVVEIAASNSALINASTV